MTPACLLLIVLGFVLSCPLTALMRAVGGWVGQVDRPGLRKIHDRPIPATGGVAIFIAFVAPALLGLAAAWWAPDSWWQRWLAPATEHLAGMQKQTGMALALLAGAALLHVVGLIDDRRDLGPFNKLAAQIVASFVLVVFFDVRLFEWWGLWPSGILTVLWFVAIINAFNFMDNMDGLAGGVATICASVFLAAALVNGQWFIASLLGLLVGAMLGFLVFNFPPARIFMGDGGSLVVGLIIAFCSVRITYYDPAAGRAWYAVFTPLVVLAVPLYDLTSVTLIRLGQGRSPFVGDTQHFSHRLVRRGLSRRAAVVLIYACTLATGLGGAMLGRLAGWQAALIVAQTAAVILVLALLEAHSPTRQDEP